MQSCAALPNLKDFPLLAKLADDYGESRNIPDERARWLDDSLAAMTLSIRKEWTPDETLRRKEGRQLQGPSRSNRPKTHDAAPLGKLMTMQYKRRTGRLEHMAD